MGRSDVLESIFRILAHRSADLDDQINRLKRAKRELTQEQEADLQNLRLLLNPEIGGEWEGFRARAFDRKQDDARDAMKTHLSYDLALYQQRIKDQMAILKQEGNHLQNIGAMAKDAESLLAQGKKGWDAFDHQCVQIRRRM